MPRDSTHTSNVLNLCGCRMDMMMAKGKRARREMRRKR